MDDFITVTTTGTNITTSGTSQRITIPLASSGETPRFIRVAANQTAYIKIGTVTVTAIAGDVLVQPADAVIMHVPSGVTYLAAIQDTTAGKVNIVALENT